jgi:hypothetical protein
MILINVLKLISYLPEIVNIISVCIAKARNLDQHLYYVYLVK